MSKLVIVISGLLVMSCLLPGMIPLNPDPTEPAEPAVSAEPLAPAASLPTMEKDGAALLETLQGGEWIYLRALVEEKYTEADFAKPGTLTFTVNLTEEKPTYFNYGWCTTTEEILHRTLNTSG